MRGVPSGTRRVTAVVAALVVLSIVWGDTLDGSAAGVAPGGPVALSPLAGWDSIEAVTLAAPAAGIAGDLSDPRPSVTSHALVELRSDLRAIAGIPPWVIWPPSPMPRIAGTLIRRPTLNVLVGVHHSAPQVGWKPTSSLPPAIIGENPRLALRVPRPPARMAGADHSIPRPPPLAVIR
jgi:hypothetical protein